MARNTFVRDETRRTQEFHARCLHGELLDAGWPARLAPFAALFFAGAKTEDWLREHLGDDNAQYILENRFGGTPHGTAQVGGELVSAGDDRGALQVALRFRTLV